jgi:hypothetical protein
MLWSIEFAMVFSIEIVNSMLRMNLTLMVLIYKLPRLHEVWLDEAGRHKGKEDLFWKCHQNEDFMRAKCQDTCERSTTPGLTPPPVAGSFPDAASISDDDSVDSSVCSQHS